MTTTVTERLRELWSDWRRETPLWPLALYRFVLGLVLFVGVVRFFWHGWIDQLYVMPRFYFSYPGFDWVKPWPAPYIHLHFALMGLAALGIALGLFYRVSAAAFVLLFTYVELLDKTNYLNHYYLVSVIALMFVFMPLGNAWSLDAWRKGTSQLLAPGWCLRALKLQAGLVYFFAGVAKLNADWLVHAQPLKIWLSAHGDMWLVGPLLSQPWVAHVASIAAALFDLAVPFLLLSKRWRLPAFAIVLGFHLFTAALFHLGLFPWLMIANAALFFAPTEHAKARVVELPRSVWARVGFGVLALHFALQLMLPLRHWLYPGDVAWTEEGYRFAWNVMRTEKAGRVVFTVRDAVGRERLVYPREYLTPLQEKMMSTQPDMIADLARHIAQERGAGTRVFAEAYASLNGRPSEALVQPDCELSAARSVLATEPCVARSLSHPAAARAP